jgi:hypothetical protein
VPSAAPIAVSQRRSADGVSPRSKANQPASNELRPAETISLRRTPSCRAAVSSAGTVARCRSTVGASSRAGLWCSTSNRRAVEVSTSSAVRESAMEGCSNAWRIRSIDPSIVPSASYSVSPDLANAAGALTAVPSSPDWSSSADTAPSPSPAADAPDSSGSTRKPSSRADRPVTACSTLR